MHVINVIKVKAQKLTFHLQLTMTVSRPTSLTKHADDVCSCYAKPKIFLLNRRIKVVLGSLNILAASFHPIFFFLTASIALAIVSGETCRRLLLPLRNS